MRLSFLRGSSQAATLAYLPHTRCPAPTCGGPASHLLFAHRLGIKHRHPPVLPTRRCAAGLRVAERVDVRGRSTHLLSCIGILFFFPPRTLLVNNFFVRAALLTAWCHVPV